MLEAGGPLNVPPGDGGRGIQRKNEEGPNIERAVGFSGPKKKS